VGWRLRACLGPVTSDGAALEGQRGFFSRTFNARTVSKFHPACDGFVTV
jgi:hypothetical protein